MIASTFLVVLSAFSALASAQSSSFTTCCNITPSSVETNTRLAWCRAQQNTCPLLCTNGQVSNNTCDQATLTYNCTCLSGITPNVSDYGATLPSLECESWVGQCTAAHPNDLNGQTFCQSFSCGKKNASAQFASSGGSSSSSSTSRAASTASSTGTATTSNTAAASTSRAAAIKALQVGKEFGTAGVAIGLMALFGLAL